MTNTAYTTVYPSLPEGDGPGQRSARETGGPSTRADRPGLSVSIVCFRTQADSQMLVQKTSQRRRPNASRERSPGACALPIRSPS